MNRESGMGAVRLERVILAPPHEVYRAWLEPELLRRWLAPDGLSVKQAQVEPRVGGRFRIWHTDPHADAGGFECEIVELVPDRRIVFLWGFVGPERTSGPTFDSLLTVELQPTGGEEGTLLTLLHERLDDLAAAMPHVAAIVESGWASALAKLVALGQRNSPEATRHA